MILRPDRPEAEIYKHSYTQRLVDYPGGDRAAHLNRQGPNLRLSSGKALEAAEAGTLGSNPKGE
jgi:hypothetical protein